MHDKQWYVDNHRKMWNWIADQIESAHKVECIPLLKNSYAITNGFSIIFDCFACQYKKDSNGSCSKCLFSWGKSEWVGCMDGYYLECMESSDWRKQVALARKIAKLPVRKEV